VKLIDGEIVDIAPIGGEHALLVSRLSQHFAVASSGWYFVSTQDPVRLDELSEP
jgi:hypothetical protein